MFEDVRVLFLTLFQFPVKKMFPLKPSYVGLQFSLFLHIVYNHLILIIYHKHIEHFKNVTDAQYMQTEERIERDVAQFNFS